MFVCFTKSFPSFDRSVMRELDYEIWLVKISSDKSEMFQENSPGKLPPGNSHPLNSSQANSPRKTLIQKIPPGIFPAMYLNILFFHYYHRCH